MVVLETIGRLRREHFVKGRAIKEIARDLKISRNTVRKIIRSEKTSFSYDREVQPQPKLEHWSAELDRLLTTNASKPAREQQPAISDELLDQLLAGADPSRASAVSAMRSSSLRKPD